MSSALRMARVLKLPGHGQFSATDPAVLDRTICFVALRGVSKADRVSIVQYQLIYDWISITGR